jgi:hypothetical protein
MKDCILYCYGLPTDTISNDITLSGPSWGGYLLLFDRPQINPNPSKKHPYQSAFPFLKLAEILGFSGFS